MNMHFPKLRFSADLAIIILAFIIWRIVLSGAALISFLILPLFSRNFLGGGYELYNRYLYLLPWANFDGEHYMSIAQQGYKSLEQAFFPMFPLLIYSGSLIFPSDFLTTVSVGLFVSNLAFIAGLWLFYKLIKLDYPRNTSLLIIAVLLTFPTAFYFGALYTESLFLLFSVGAFYFTRKKNFWLGGVMGFLASITRVFGVLVFISLIIEVWQSKTPLKKALPILIAPGGLFAYMGYLWWTVGDPLAFYHLQSIIGEHRQQGIVVFPQVVYRYLKILFNYPHLDIFLAPLLLEFITTLLFFCLPIIGFLKKMRLSYLFYSMVSLLLPTIQGSFSSGSRYILVIFPSFIVLGLLIQKLPKILQVLVLILFGVLQAFFAALFIRGYWVA